MGQPTSFVVRYKGSSQAEIERQFDLDRERRARHGYVPKHAEWVPVGGVYSFRHMSWLAALVGVHPTLLVTYTLEESTPSE